MATATQEPQTRTRYSVLPFTVEIDLPRNGHLVIQSIPGRASLRSRFDATKTTAFGGNSERKDDQVIPMTQIANFGTHPAMPGQRIHVDPEKGEYVISDPMRDNKELLSKFARWLDTQNVIGNNERNGFPTVKGHLDIDWMKTLCRELYHVIKNKDGRLVEGPSFDLDDVDSLPGDYLLNPGSTIRTSQPKYEKQLESWERQLNQVGG